jgi:ubiquinol-cytochrome c reductase cytochrome c1 subunit
MYICNSDVHVASFMVQSRNLLQKQSVGYAPSERSTQGKKKGSNILAFVGAGVMGMLGMASCAYADEAEHGLPAPSYPWPNDGLFASYDHASLVSIPSTKQ